MIDYDNLRQQIKKVHNGNFPPFEVERLILRLEDIDKAITPIREVLKPLYAKTADEELRAELAPIMQGKFFADLYRNCKELDRLAQSGLKELNAANSEEFPAMLEKVQAREQAASACAKLEPYTLDMQEVLAQLEEYCWRDWNLREILCPDVFDPAVFSSNVPTTSAFSEVGDFTMDKAKEASAAVKASGFKSLDSHDLRVRSYAQDWKSLDVLLRGYAYVTSILANDVSHVLDETRGRNAEIADALQRESNEPLEKYVTRIVQKAHDLRVSLLQKEDPNLGEAALVALDTYFSLRRVSFNARRLEIIHAQIEEFYASDTVTSILAPYFPYPAGHDVTMVFYNPKNQDLNDFCVWYARERARCMDENPMACAALDEGNYHLHHFVEVEKSLLHQSSMGGPPNKRALEWTADPWYLSAELGEKFYSLDVFSMRRLYTAIQGLTMFFEKYDNEFVDAILTGTAVIDYIVEQDNSFDFDLIDSRAADMPKPV